jgi:hypothetical protein
MRTFRCFVGLALALVSSCLSAGEDKVIFIRESPTNLIYVIGGASISSDELSGYFSKHRGNWSLRDTEVKVVLPQDASFNSFFYAKARLQAVGFSHLRFFVQSPRTGKIVQIQTVGSSEVPPSVAP